MNKKVLYLVHGAVIAALYVVLTMLANALGLANYPIQVRFSEALTILPVFTPAAIPGLFLGCIISNTMTGCMLLDIIFGSLATLIGAFGTYLLRDKNKWLAPLPPIIANIIIVPFVLAYVYHLEGGIPYFMLTVGKLFLCVTKTRLPPQRLCPCAVQGSMRKAFAALYSRLAFKICKRQRHILVLYRNILRHGQSARSKAPYRFYPVFGKQVADLLRLCRRYGYYSDFYVVFSAKVAKLLHWINRLARVAFFRLVNRGVKCRRNIKSVFAEAAVVKQRASQLSRADKHSLRTPVRAEK